MSGMVMGPWGYKSCWGGTPKKNGGIGEVNSQARRFVGVETTKVKIPHVKSGHYLLLPFEKQEFGRK